MHYAIIVASVFFFCFFFLSFLISLPLCQTYQRINTDKYTRSKAKLTLWDNGRWRVLCQAEVIGLPFKVMGRRWIDGQRYLCWTGWQWVIADSLSLTIRSHLDNLVCYWFGWDRGGDRNLMWSCSCHRGTSWMRKKMGERALLREN